jgi:hypothetical protein
MGMRSCASFRIGILQEIDSERGVGFIFYVGKHGVVTEMVLRNCYEPAVAVCVSACL